MRITRLVRAVLVLTLCWSASPVPGCAQIQPIDEDQGITGLGLALRRLPTIGSVLYITAHPDDENNAVLAKLTRKEGLRVGLLTLTRGDGGQNEIGPELFEALGVLRSEELMSMHRYDKVEQYFSRAYEFGYSFSVEESLEKWGRQDTLQDIVRVIRQFRPHAIISLNPGGTGGGQHHQASAQLAEQAYGMAGDASVFPDQVQEGLRPWRPLRLFQSGGPGMGGRQPSTQAEPDVVSIELGEYDPLLGETYAQFGARIRQFHRSQGMMSLGEPGAASARYRLVRSEVPLPPGATSFLDGIETGLGSLANFDPNLAGRLHSLAQTIDQSRAAFGNLDLKLVAERVMQGLQAARDLKSTAAHPEAVHFLSKTVADFEEAAAHAHFIYLDAVLEKSSDYTVVPGQRVQVRVRLVNHSPVPVKVEEILLEAPAGWTVSPAVSNQAEAQFEVDVSPQAEVTEPYWFRPDRSVDRFSVRPPYTGSEPFVEPPLTARVHYSALGVRSSLKMPVYYRWFDPVSAQERQTMLAVVPRLSVSLDPTSSVVQQENPKEKTWRVTVRNNQPGAARARVRLEVPRGWERADEGERELPFEYENQETALIFKVKPPSQVPPGLHQVRAVAILDGQLYDRGYQAISYHHVQTRHLYQPALSQVRAVRVKIPSSLKVGYVMGVGDEVGRATEEIGAEVVYLSEADLASGNLDQFDVIVTGVRAYLNRKDLIAHNQRLLDYVKRGGHLVVQYNKYEFHDGPFTPYPVRIHSPHDRNTVEDSAVRILQPEHPIFHYPNEITQADWSGWVQERGLYFLGEWDNRFQPLLELQDPWPYNSEPDRGSLLVARHGEGTYIYTGLAFFRQLPEGVAGAYRLWANILSLGSRD